MHELPSIYIDFVFDFTQADLDVYFLMGIPLVMKVDVNRGYCFIKLNKLFYGIKQASTNLFDLLKLV